MGTHLTCPPCAGNCVQGMACTHQPAPEPATDSDLQRWIEESEGDQDHTGRAQGWFWMTVISGLFYGGIALLIRSCS